ncbi:enoyl-CoA hydratase-related protein [Zavarzinia compransoris]|uniref:enoyl-CoA hydratase-related protein n=1 Tax=Zavarzinia marina TaxID=2911065 RepID=UPI001F383BBD|nr:enoyl-CoA hydratase-related protein [Zavarzinia marina]MCF4164539.1 enoyl-CoA hydratase-related protein [Zavarzinia marina]
MTYETLLYERRGGVAQITLNRPEVLNALNEPMYRELTLVFDDAAADPGIRAVLLTGAGRAFCSGADLARPRPIPEGGTLGDAVADTMHALINPMVARIAALPKPVVCAVNGVVAGGGVGVALACDIVVAAKSASFIQVFGPNLGIVPDIGCTWLVPRLVGRARAMGLALLGEKLPADKAADWGLIWQAVEDAELMATASALADRLAAGPTTGFGLIKKALTASEGNDFAAQLALEAESQRIAFNTNDTMEGVAAFLQKRKPVFTGA